ncbi:dehydrogenase [bacterium]|nr:dehydrogenase [bacterium]
MKHLTLSFSLLAASLLAGSAADQPALQLKKGDHIALIGNALPDRMQFDGYLETLITAAYPNDDLTFRNLGRTGDEVVTRARSANFGTPDEWLEKTKTDVILAYFGFNESFNGEAGLDKFKTDLDTFLKQTKAMNYSGNGAPRIVLFSPIAAEHHQDPNFALPDKINANVELYTKAMGEVARQNGVPFVDLYAPTKSLFDYNRDQKQSLTIDGQHLSQDGDRVLAPIMFRALFGKEPPQGDFSKLREAINAKNWQWHMRYRTIDGYNVYGGRSELAYQPDKGAFITDRDPKPPFISNYEVMQREMQMRDVMVANRDKRVWAIAQGGDLEVDDSNLPPPIDVPTNERGSNPDGTFPVTGGEEMISEMKVHSNMKVNLFASDEQFPELISPLQMMWDTKGRLWVTVWRNYPERKPTSTIGDSVLIFEDTDGDGKADKVTHFLDGLNAPTGFQFYKDGLLVMQAPDLWYVRDTDGDDHADTKERVLMGMDSADSHHTANALSYDPGGAIYLSDGVFHRTQVETANGPVRNLDAGIYRFEPVTGRFERYISYGFANPHGKVFDRWGNGIMTDATGNNSYFDAAFSGHIDYPMKHPGMKQFWDRPSRPCPGTGWLSSRHFPDELQGTFMNCNVIGFQGIYLVKVTDDGSGIKGETIEPLVSSTNYNFRPSNVDIGPDGAIYFLDWEKPLIGHMQHHLRDPNRYFPHGRIYRITYDGRPLLKQPKIDGQPIPDLLELLKSPEDGVRQLAKIELAKHDAQEVAAAVQKWITTLDKSSPDYEHEMMEALWVHQWNNVVNVDLLKRMLNSPDPRAVAAAGRVLCYWRDRVPDALDLFRKLANDASPRVRLEAVRAASFFDSPEAAEVALEVLKHPMDYYLEYTLKETMRQLEPVWRKALSEGKSIAADNPKGVEYILNAVPNSGLANLPRIPGVLEAYLTRPGITDADRAVALADLADKKGTDRTTLLMDLIKGSYKDDAAAQANLARQLPTVPPDELKSKRTMVAELTKPDAPGVARPAAWAALAAADGSFDAVFNRAEKDPAELTELLNGIPLLMDPTLRAAAWPKVRPLLTSLPGGWDSGKMKAGTKGRYVRIELPRRGTLTLAEVEVMSDGRNIARFGKASESSVANGGTADRAIDGRTDGDFGSGTQTHTRENSRDPWWEVDLGATRPINSVVVWNRTEGELGKRLDHFTLQVLDDSRNVIFEQKDNPAPEKNVTINVSTDPVGTMRRAAIQALASMGTKPAETFGALSDLIVKGEEVVEATRALRSVPRASWPAKEAGADARALVDWAKSVPTDARTSQDFVETTQTASDLTGLLPAPEAVALRHQLKDIRVAMFVVRTVREQMRYDTPRMVVEAGKPFQVIIVNDDFMPHNMVVSMPGGREIIGPMSDKMQPDKLDSKGRAFIPSSVTHLSQPNELILDATPLIEPGQQATLKLTAPEKEGDYNYFCTFPGHWPVMWGILVVTKDVDAYLQAHPVATQLPAANQKHDHSFE